MTGSEATIAGGLGTIMGVFFRPFAEAVTKRWRNGHSSSPEAKEALLRNVLREESKSVFVDALGQHVVPVLSNHTEKFDSLISVNKEIEKGIAKLVTLQESRERRGE